MWGSCWWKIAKFSYQWWLQTSNTAAQKGKSIRSHNYYHSNVAHGGCGFTLNEIRGAGYWIVGANSAVKKVISNSVECRRFRGRVGEQKMANLPACRLKEAAPFTHCRVDMFGPIAVKQRRSTVKWYGAMFTCMASRAVHVEVLFSLDTDSFILALQRLVAYREEISDQSTQTMEVISLVLSKNWRKRIWRWMTGKFNLSC